MTSAAHTGNMAESTEQPPELPEENQVLAERIQRVVDGLVEFTFVHTVLNLKEFSDDDIAAAYVHTRQYIRTKKAELDATDTNKEGHEQNIDRGKTSTEYQNAKDVRLLLEHQISRLSLSGPDTLDKLNDLYFEGKQFDQP
jgi:hypothetical protein